MKHFTNEAWADYVRGATHPDQRVQMERHLQEGCTTCERTVNLWQGVMAAARREASFQPPDSVVRFVNGYFGMDKPRQKLPKVAELVFDTFRQPLPAGIRSSQGSARHLVFRGGSMWVDLRLEPAFGEGQASLTGQISDRGNSDCGVSDLPVAVRSPDRPLVSTSTNEFGEFHLELGAGVRKDLHLSIGIGGDDSIIIPLRVLDAPGEQVVQGN